MFRNLLAITFLIPALASGQITITSADMPNAGDSVIVSRAAGTGTTDPSIAGAGLTWDFSAITPVSQRYEKFDSPLTFTTPFNLLFNPFNTSYGKDNYTLTSLPIPGVTLSDAYDFFKESSSSMKQVGSGYTINGTPIPFIFSQADIIYTFPMNYGNSDSCNFKFGLPIPAIGYYGQTGHRVNNVDGWGTVITPFATYNALKITSRITATDTLYLDLVGLGSNIPRPLQVQYKWFAAGSKVPVMEVDGTNGPGGFIATNVQYIDSLQLALHAGITEAGKKNGLVLYPNPMDDNAVLLLEDPAETIVLSDVQGRIVKTIPAKGLSRVEIQRNDLPAGLYFYTVLSRTGTASGKLIMR